MNLAAKISLATVGVVAALLVAFAVMVWWSMRPLDHTVAHGDECLAELQDGYVRCWDIHVPANVTPLPPLVIDLHGYTGNKVQQKELTGFLELADEEGFIVAWPQGLQRSWNAGGDAWPEPDQSPNVEGQGCCGTSLFEQVDDVVFLRRMITDLIQRYGADPRRVYVTGLSNGCTMAQRMAAQASDVVAAVACTSMFLLSEVAPSYMPTPVLEVHGTLDEVVRYEPAIWQGARANFEAWLSHNRCGEPQPVWESGGHTLLQADDCALGASVGLLTVAGAGHIPYLKADEAAPDTTRIMWTFLKSRRLPET